MESEDIRDDARCHEGLPLERGRARTHTDGAQERDYNDPEIARVGRMVNIVVILEHDKAKNEAPSPRKDNCAEDSREGLQTPQLSFNARSKQLA